MQDPMRTAIILEMVEKLREKGNWGGETHLQKAMFFLEERRQVEAGYDFVLYKHGPYSFDLHEAVASLFARGLLENEICPPYGPKIRLTEAGECFLAHQSAQMEAFKASVAAVAGWFGPKGVAELEKLATALWAKRRERTLNDSERANWIHEIKPHISPEKARQALEALDALTA